MLKQTLAVLSEEEPALIEPLDSESMLVVIRRPQTSDGDAIWKLQLPEAGSRVAVHREAMPALSSCFADTSLVAEIGGCLVGFVGAHRPPSSRSSLIVWQIDVAPAVRRRGLASALLHTLIQCPGCAGIEYVEATIHPANEAGKQLFESFARDLRSSCELNACFALSSSPHGEADLLRVGPIRVENAMKLEKTHEAL